MRFAFKFSCGVVVIACAAALPANSSGTRKGSPPIQSTSQEDEFDGAIPDDVQSLSELKRTGFQRSRFNLAVIDRPNANEGQRPETSPDIFESTVEPLLQQYCYDCHGYGANEGNLRLDELDADFVRGSDSDWWMEVFGAVAKGEMPPADYTDMNDGDRSLLVSWLSLQLQRASQLRRQSRSQSSLRRLTRYEYNYALQDLLGLPWNFAKDLPPDPSSEDGFRNNAELLHLTVSQFETYQRLAREALDRATFGGERPQTMYWGISMQEAAAGEWSRQSAQLEEVKNRLVGEPEELSAKLSRLEETFRKPYATAYYKNFATGRTAPAEWAYQGARYAFAPTMKKPMFPKDSGSVAILPAGRLQELTIELGNQLPDEGTMRVTVRASRLRSQSKSFPSLQLLFGWQASNEGRALLRVSDADVSVKGPPGEPQLVQWEIELGEIYPRNSVRKTSPMGATPSPSEYIRIANSAAADADVQIDYVLVEAPVFDEWPPVSHQHIFVESQHAGNEDAYAEEILLRFMRRAWRRPISREEVDRKLRLFATVRPQTDTFEDAMVEVLATVLASPQFLLVSFDSQVGREGGTESPKPNSLDAYHLATRLSLFLWCSIPDEELLALAESGELAKQDVLASQVERLLADPRSERIAKHFVQQWLNLELLEFVNLKQHLDPLLQEAMAEEPIAQFAEMVKENATVLDFVHADYAMVNERLAQHYGISDVYGNHLRRVGIDDSFRRGGLLTQAGLLTMNSDYPDSHPLKRAVWLLECLLADPPPPPPPAVPQIDLADPEIARMTLKERIEDHRNHAACKSCHVKIDPWGIAFENYDALGRWREDIQGKPVDASSDLFNHQTLDGMEGLKRFLLMHRQDQFVQAMVQKLATYALGRPLNFADRAEIDAITANVRRSGDGLRTMIQAVVASDLFREP